MSAASVASWSPHSPFYAAATQDDRLAQLRLGAFPTRGPASAYLRASHFTDDFVERLDQIDELGGEDRAGNLIGHAGCVNALAWSQSGHCLATGSDDKCVILWRMGSTDENPQAAMHEPSASSMHDDEDDSLAGPTRSASERGFPKLCLGQSDVIETGHRANIFSVKWAPNCSDRRLFTCAGDSQMRVFDLTRATSHVDERLSTGKEYRRWPADQGACIRVLRCHSSRAKRISTENSPDVFLSCAEDGEVRQTDLRVPHTCSRSRGYGLGCPRPLTQFDMELYSLSVSKVEPWLFAVAGTSDKVFLMDRRMVPRLLRREWGTEVPAETPALAQCVRMFGREPRESNDAEDEDKRQEAARRRRYERAHVTAVKISGSNGRDLIASYSGDGIYKFDIHGEPGVRKHMSNVHTSKRRKQSSGDSTPTRERDANITMSEAERQMARRRAVRLLFPRPLQGRRPGRHDEVRRALEKLANVLEQEAAHHDTEFLQTEMATIALCLALLAMRQKPSMEESQHPDVSKAKAILQSHSETQIGQQILPLLEEIEEASHWEATGELAKLRILLTEQSERLVRDWWDRFRQADVSEEEKDRDRPSASVVAASDSGPFRQSENEGAGQQMPLPPEMVQRMSRLVDMDEDDDGEGNSDSDDDEMSEATIARALEGLQDDASDDDDDDDDDDDSEEGYMEELSSDDELDSAVAINGDGDDDGQRGLPDGAKPPLVYPVTRFAGHSNNETVKDCGFVGSNDEYVWSGSDCGHFFMWGNTDEDDPPLKGIWKGDGSVVNVLAQHPRLPVCAVSGIDDTVKIFGPIGQGPKVANRFHKRNEIIKQNTSTKPRVGLSARALMRFFAQHSSEGAELRSIGANGEDEECSIM